MNPFVEQRQDAIGCVLSCFDRALILGTLPAICHAKAMAGHLGARDIRLFDDPCWAEPLRDAIRANAERLAAEGGWRASTSASSRRSARRTESSRSSPSAAIGPAWCTSSAPWRPALRIAPGTTRRAARPFSSRSPASVCTITSTSSTHSLACAMCACRPGRRFACRSTSTATAGWRDS